MFDNQKINKLIFAISFVYILIKDWWNGFERKKLRDCLFQCSDKSNFTKIDNLGDIVIMNGFSRAGGKLNEWNKTKDGKEFSPQLIDGVLNR